MIHVTRTEVMTVGAVVLLAIIVLVIILIKKKPRKLHANRFQEKWAALQKLCKNKQTWPQALVAADDLLDEALKKRRFAGKTMGARLTKAQRVISNNEAVWFGHKLRGKLAADSELKLKETEVKEALLGIRQALKDLGAFSNDK